MSAESGFADVNGARLWYEVAGRGPAVVLVHAGIVDSGMWKGQFDRFAEQYRVVRYDARGYGRSNLPGGPYSHADDLRALFEYLDLGPAAIVGVSMGGAADLELALSAPELVTALVLVGSGLPGHEWSEEVRRLGETEDELLERGDVDGAVELNMRLWVDGPRRTPADVDPAVRSFAAEMQRRAIEIQLPVWQSDTPPERIGLDPSPHLRLGEVRAPTLIVVGAEDVPDVHAIAEQLQTGIAGATTVVLEGTAHLPPLERPEEFNEAVLDFLDGID